MAKVALTVIRFVILLSLLLGILPQKVEARHGSRRWLPASKRVKSMIRGGRALNAKNEQGFTPLFEEVRKGHLIVVDMLLSAGARLDIPAPFSWTCLHEAVKRRDRRMVDLLLYRGADPNTKDHWGKTAMHLAYENEDEGMVSLLLAYHAKDPTRKLHWSYKPGVTAAY